jgi:hypothetical protein
VSYGVLGKDPSDRTYYLTPKGIKVSYIHSKCNSKVTVRVHKGNTKVTVSKIDLTDRQQDPPRKQLSIERFLSSMDAGEAEVVVVDALVKHYNESNQKFVYFPGTKDSPDWYQVAEYFHLDVETVREAISALNSERKVMKYADKSVGKWKIGLYKDFVAMLQVK